MQEEFTNRALCASRKNRSSVVWLSRVVKRRFDGREIESLKVFPNYWRAKGWCDCEILHAVEYGCVVDSGVYSCSLCLGS